MKKPTLRELMGVALRNARQSKKLSQSAVAQLVNEKYGSNWGKANISDIERGLSFSLETYEEVVTVLNFELVDKPIKPVEVSLFFWKNMKKQETVPFNKDLAAQLIEQYKLSPNTLKTWAHRGHIPADYISGNMDTSDKLSDSDSEYRKFIKILKMPEIASTKFRTLQTSATNLVRHPAVPRCKAVLTQTESSNKYWVKTTRPHLFKLLPPLIKFSGGHYWRGAKN